MSDREEHLQDFPVGDFLRIEDDLDGFGVTRIAVAHDFVLGRALLAPRVAGQHALHAVEMFEHALHAPETAAGKHRLLFGPRRPGVVDRRRRNEECLFSRTRRHLREHPVNCSHRYQKSPFHTGKPPVSLQSSAGRQS